MTNWLGSKMRRIRRGLRLLRALERESTYLIFLMEVILSKLTPYHIPQSSQSALKALGVSKELTTGPPPLETLWLLNSAG